MNLIDRLHVLIETRMQVNLEEHEDKPASVPQVLKEIGDRRKRKALKRYVNQFRSYFERPKFELTPHKFEVAFGQEDEELPPTRSPI